MEKRRISLPAKQLELKPIMKKSPI